MKPAKYVKHFRIDKPGKFRLADYDPADTMGLDIEKSEAKDILERTGADDVSSTGEAKADFAKTDKPMRRAS